MATKMSVGSPRISDVKMGVTIQTKRVGNHCLTASLALFLWDLQFSPTVLELAES